MKKPRILYIITDLNYGGAEKQFEILVKHSTAFAKPFVAGLKGWGKTAQSLSHDNIPIWVKNQLDIPVKTDFPEGWRGLLQLAKAFKPDIIHTFLFRANIIGRILSRFIAPRPKVISSVRVWDERWLPVQIEQLTQSWCDGVVFNSQWIANEYSKKTNLDPLKKITIPNAIEPFSSEFIDTKSAILAQIPRNNLDFIILSIGRLDQQKGFQFLIEAIGNLKTKIPNIKLKIAGDGPQKHFLENKIRDLNLTDNIELLGFRPDAKLLLRSYDIFVLPSLWEGSPNVILEAWQEKIPVIATSVGGTPELIKDGENGLLVPPKDSKKIADAIEKIHNDKILVNKLIENGQKSIIDDRNPEKIIEKYFNLYTQLMTKSA